MVQPLLPSSPLFHQATALAERKWYPVSLIPKFLDWPILEAADPTPPTHESFGICVGLPCKHSHVERGRQVREEALPPNPAGLLLPEPQSHASILLSPFLWILNTWSHLVSTHRSPINVLHMTQFLQLSWTLPCTLLGLGLGSWLVLKK